MRVVTSGTIFFTLVLTLILVHLSNNAVINNGDQVSKQDIEVHGLYSDQDNVEILTIENFKSEIFGSKHAWLVEFYNSWCGFCQRFAPSWKEFAVDINGWQDLVRIGVIDCSNEENNPVCREFEVMSYPTLRYFHENYQEGKNFGMKVPTGSDAVDHRQKLLDVIIDEEEGGRGNMYPNILPYTEKDVLKLFESLQGETEYAFMLIQNDSEFLGQEIAMDLHKTKSIVVRYGLSTNNDLVKNLNAYELPALFVLGKDNTWNSLTTTSKNRHGYKSAIYKFLQSKNINIPLEDVQKEKVLDHIPDINVLLQEREMKELKEKIKKMGDVVFQMDLETALRFSLKREVSRNKEIMGDKLEALKNYVNVLLKYFPFGKYGQMFLVQLHDYVNSGELVKGVEIAKIVKDAEQEHRMVFSAPQQWLGCQGSSPEHRGYPCGLWKLFHYLTVNAADQNVTLKTSNPKVVLNAMHGYIKNFFGCADCSNHFQEMAKRREIQKVDSWNGSILWLWSAHNEVNNRLAGDVTEDPDYPKIQFPAKERCAQCYNSDDSWNTNEVLQYLKHVYSSINVRYIGSDTRIVHLALEGFRPSGSSSIFKTIDTKNDAAIDNYHFDSEDED